MCLPNQLLWYRLNCRVTDIPFLPGLGKVCLDNGNSLHYCVHHNSRFYTLLSSPHLTQITIWLTRDYIIIEMFVENLKAWLWVNIKDSTLNFGWSLLSRRIKAGTHNTDFTEECSSKLKGRKKNSRKIKNRKIHQNYE